jgi:hypothetical protein
MYVSGRRVRANSQDDLNDHRYAFDRKLDRYARGTAIFVDNELCGFVPVSSDVRGSYSRGHDFADLTTAEAVYDWEIGQSSNAQAYLNSGVGGASAPAPGTGTISGGES